MTKKITPLALAAAPLMSLLLLQGCTKTVSMVGSTASTAAPDAAKQKPTPPPAPKPEPIEARAIYITGWTASGKKSMERIMALIDKTPLNAVVIDVKDSDGAITYKSDVPLAKEVMAHKGKVKEIGQYGYGSRAPKIDNLMAELKKRDIYPIARLAVFADDCMPRVRPEYAVKRKDGGIWENRKREAWANPYKKEVWEYNVALAEEAIKKGFKEIQWDYVRFPTDGKLLNMAFPGKTQTPPPQVINEFLKFAKERVHKAGGVMSADIFGLTVLSKNDMGIGQTIRSIAEHVDYICPMVYPSHYNRGEYGIPNPDRAPYKTVFVSLRDGKERIKGTDCKIRPWLQNFNLQSKYRAPDIWAQIKAARDNGINEYLLWDPNNRYTHTAEAFKLQEIAEAKEKKQKQVAAKPGPETAPKPN
ncbi:MAG: putative glycoside hydrolase [Armatimonadetes bacterium]|nr:putative glycoside hydrolase [Armatimonadota bacterium]